ncbi:MAG: S8 family serine peptidase [Cyanothece sp. SIO2G6]|nr:S8 family serine peptidase [Cyanothece sp. SIO2G6]
MRREYIVRNERVSIEEIEGIVAILPREREASQADLSQSFGEILEASSRAGENPDWQSFENAGWIFVRPNDVVQRALDTGSRINNAEAAQRVFRHSSGRTFLGTDRLSVKLRAEMSEEEVSAALDAANLEIVNRLKFAPNLYEVRVTGDRNFLQVSVELAGNSDFLYAEPQFIEHIPPRFTPTDPSYGEQWHLNNTGQDGGMVGADISAEDAWDMTRGAGVTIAVVDGGFDVAHRDLAAAITATSGYFQMDGMGNTALVQGLVGFPSANHGTFCAGMAAARANNGEGGSGVANQAALTVISVLNDALGTQATLSRAIAYAADPTQEVPGANPNDGADVISCSLGPNSMPWTMTQTLEDAIDFAVASGRGGLGTPIFWATDNGNVPVAQDEVVSYANTIAVGRSTRNDLEDNSAFGPELDFLATGVDVFSTQSGGGYGTDTGTSYAAPTAAGVGTLMLAVNPNLTWQQVRQILRDTCDQIGGVVYDASGRNDDYGFGRVNAAQAVCNASRVVELQTPSVQFNDVPEGAPTARAIVFSVTTCLATTFQIVSGPTVTSGPGSFGTLSSPNAALPATGGLSTREARLWLSFTGTNDGDIAIGEVTVRLVETGEEWLIPISANTIARPTVATVLCLDQSGSMQSPSGLDGFVTRNDVLKFAAPIFINLLQEDNGIGIVAFDDDAYNRMNVQTVGPPSPFDPARSNALGVIASHTYNSAGNTAIGDAVEEAVNRLNAVSGYDQEAIIVFTDGHETAAKYIADVAPLINERVFAIGLGTADQIQPAALTALTNSTGGYLLLTGTIGPEDLFLLNKYYLQILAGVTNQDIVLDPEGAIKPGQTHRIPFQLNEADVSADTILMAETSLPVFRFALETPSGDLIDPSIAGVTSGIDYVSAQGVSFYRMTLPVPIAAGARAGKWHAVLTVDEVYYKRYLSTLDNFPELYNQVLAHGVRYSLSVHSYSGLRLQAQLLQDSLEPGAILTIRAVLTEYGLPIDSSRATVRAEFERPDGTGGVLTLHETEAGSGIYTANLQALLSGVYRFRVLANGSTLRGRIFIREHLLTGSVWQGGNNSPPTSTDDPRGDQERLCRLLNCLVSEKVMRPEFERRLEELGLDLNALRACIKAWCQQPRVASIQLQNTSTLTSMLSTGETNTLTTEVTTFSPVMVDLIRQLARELEDQQ